MTAHSCKLKDGGVRQLVHASAKAQGVLDTMTGNPGFAAATFGLVDGSADVDRDPKIRAADVVNEILHVFVVVKNRRHSCVALNSRDYLFRIGLLIPLPVGFRIQILARTEYAAFSGVTDIYGVMLQRQAQKLAIFLHQIVVIDVAR